MGQARRRGSKEERVLEGIEKDKQKAIRREELRQLRLREEAETFAALTPEQQKAKRKARENARGLLTMAAAMSISTFSR